MARKAGNQVNPRFLGQTAAEMPLDPAPPYQVAVDELLLAEVAFDPAAVRAALPPGLEPLDDCTGAIAFFSAPHGWGLAPFTCFYIGLFIKGYDSLGGDPAIYLPVACYSGKAGVTFPRDYNTQAVPGFSRQWQEGSDYFAEGGAAERPMVRIAFQSPTLQDQSVIRSGVHHYVGQDGTEGQTIHSIAFTGRDYPASMIFYDVLPAATDLIRSLTPVRWIFATRTPHMAVTFGPPRPLLTSQTTLKADAAQISLMDLLSHIGHAVALVALDGRVLFINNLAREMLAGALNGGRLTAWRRQDQTHLGAALSALRPGHLSPPVALRRPGGALPILARALPTSAALTGEPAALLLFNDPIAPAPSAELTLNLLGLTPAEARIAAQVGRGLTFREAARIVGVTETTARSTMKAVYGKLMIGKQSELALIVARLEGFG